MTPNDKLSQLERAFELAIVEAMKATNGAGLKVHIVPEGPYKPAHLCQLASTPTPEQFREKIVSMASEVSTHRQHYRGEEALARNIALLAKAWEAAVRYWDFQKEIKK